MKYMLGWLHSLVPAEVDMLLLLQEKEDLSLSAALETYLTLVRSFRNVDHTYARPASVVSPSNEDVKALPENKASSSQQPIKKQNKKKTLPITKCKNL